MGASDPDSSDAHQWASQAASRASLHMHDSEPELHSRGHLSVSSGGPQVCAHRLCGGVSAGWGYPTHVTCSTVAFERTCALTGLHARSKQACREQWPPPEYHRYVCTTSAWLSPQRAAFRCLMRALGARLSLQFAQCPLGAPDPSLACTSEACLWSYLGGAQACVRCLCMAVTLAGQAASGQCALWVLQQPPSVSPGLPAVPQCLHAPGSFFVQNQVLDTSLGPVCVPLCMPLAPFCTACVPDCTPLCPHRAAVMHQPQGQEDVLGTVCCLRAGVPVAAHAEGSSLCPHRAASCAPHLAV